LGENCLCTEAETCGQNDFPPINHDIPHFLSISIYNIRGKDMNMKKEKKYGKITVFVVFFKKSITFALALKKSTSSSIR